MDPTIFAYTAGLIDGDGCILIARVVSQRSTNPYYYAGIFVSMTDFGTIQWLQTTFSGPLQKCTLSKGSTNNEVAYKWSLNKKVLVATLLSDILPYLKVKRIQALIALEFCRKFPSTTRGKRYSLAEIESMNLYHRLMALANSRGPGSSEVKLKLFRTLTADGEIGQEQGMASMPGDESVILTSKEN